MTAAGIDFRKTRFVSPNEPDQQWIAWYCEEHTRRLYNLRIEPKADVPFRFESTIRALPDVAIAQTLRSPMRTFHSGGGDEMSLLVPMTGPVSVRTEGTEYELSAGMGHLGWHAARGGVDAPSGVQLLSFRLRRRWLLPLIRNNSDSQGFLVSHDAQAMSLLRAYVRALDFQEAITAPEVGHLVALHIHDLVAQAFGPRRDAQELIELRGGRAARLAAVKADIIANIAGRDVSIDKVAARQRISPRYIGSLFAAAGTTFTDFVLEQRLAHAYRRLTDPRFAGQAISTIAYNSGFGDLSYFNHAFRRRYGTRPSDVRAEHRLAS